MDSWTTSVLLPSQGSAPTAFGHASSPVDNASDFGTPYYLELGTMHPTPRTDEGNIEYAYSVDESWHQDMRLNEISFDLDCGDRTEDQYLELDVAGPGPFSARGSLSAIATGAKARNMAAQKFLDSHAQQCIPPNTLSFAERWHTDTSQVPFSTTLSGMIKNQEVMIHHHHPGIILMTWLSYLQSQITLYSQALHQPQTSRALIGGCLPMPMLNYPVRGLSSYGTSMLSHTSASRRSWLRV